MMKTQSQNQESAENLLCPSYVAKPGAELYGIVNQSGLIDYLKATLEVTEPFMEEALKGREPEKRFRFADAVTVAAPAFSRFPSDLVIPRNALSGVPNPFEKKHSPT